MLRVRFPVCGALRLAYAFSMKIKSAVLSVVMNYRGLRFQWLTLFNSDESIDIQTRIGAGEMAGPWSKPYHISAEDLDYEPDMAHNVPFALGPSEVDELLEKRSAADIAKSPEPDWRPVKWFECDLPPGVRLDVVEGFEEFGGF